MIDETAQVLAIDLSQLPLPLGHQSDLTLDNFVSGDNQEVYDQFLSLFKQPITSFYLWGVAGCGKSHLLQAICHHYQQQGLEALYMPMAALKNAGVEVLAQLAEFDLIAIDDVDQVAAQEDWAVALFNLYNHQAGLDRQVVFASRPKPQSMSVAINDLKTRLLYGLCYHLKPLGDQDLATTLKMRATGRGLDLSDEVIEFLLRRIQRDMHTLNDIFEKLDWASLVKQKKITVPFVKQILDL